jgi:hypothetical protein
MNKHFRITSAILGILGWALIAGFVDLPPNAWWNSIWLLATLFGAGAIAASLARPPSLLLFLTNAVPLVFCWTFRNGIE